MASLLHNLEIFPNPAVVDQYLPIQYRLVCCFLKNEKKEININEYIRQLSEDKTYHQLMDLSPIHYVH